MQLPLLAVASHYLALAVMDLIAPLFAQARPLHPPWTFPRDNCHPQTLLAHAACPRAAKQWIL